MFSLKVLIASWIALYIAFVLFAHAGAIDAQGVCWLVGHTGEGFPAVACLDGKTYYADLDGDGRDATTNGRWVETDPRWVR